MLQVSFFESMKPRAILTADCSWIYEKLKKGADFEIFLEDSTHYIIQLDGVFYGIYKCNARKIV